LLEPRVALLAALAVLTAVYAAIWLSDARRRARAGERAAPTFFEVVIGAVTNFFDTLGIGSFAPTTSVFKLRRIVPDEKIPGTLNIGHAIPVVVQAFIFISAVKVELPTLFTTIAAAILGAWLGAGVVSGLRRRRIQIGMGIALLAAAVFFAMTNLGLFPGGGEALGLHGALFWIAVLAIFVLGAFNTLGIGLYAPCMILIALLGMNPRAAFPIMMGACAFLMPVASIRFVRAGSYSVGPSLGLMLGGIPAVLVAGLIVKELPLTALRWLVVAVVAYAASAMLRSARVEKSAGADAVIPSAARLPTEGSASGS
jgi:uncharacterized membrane protein YfcA